MLGGIAVADQQLPKLSPQIPSSRPGGSSLASAQCMSRLFESRSTSEVPMYRLQTLCLHVMYHSLPSLPTGVFVHAMLRVSCNTSDDHQPRVPIYSSSLCQSSSQWCTDDDSMMQNANASARKWNLVDFSDPRSTKSRFKSWLMHPASIGLFTRTSSQPRRHSHHCGTSAKQRIHCDLACHYPLLLGCWSWSRRS